MCTVCSGVFCSSCRYVLSGRELQYNSKEYLTNLALESKSLLVRQHQLSSSEFCLYYCPAVVLESRHWNEFLVVIQLCSINEDVFWQKISITYNKESFFLQHTEVSSYIKTRKYRVDFFGLYYLSRNWTCLKAKL